MKSQNIKIDPSKYRNHQPQQLQKLNLEQLNVVSGGTIILPAVRSARK